MDNGLRANRIEQGRITIHHPTKRFLTETFKDANKEEILSQTLFGKGNKIGIKSEQIFQRINPRCQRQRYNRVRGQFPSDTFQETNTKDSETGQTNGIKRNQIIL